MPLDKQQIEIIRQLPKAELHVHLLGAIPHYTLIKLLNKYNGRDLSGKAPDWLQKKFNNYPNIKSFLDAEITDNSIAALFQYKDFNHFLAVWLFVQQFIQEKEDFELLVNDVVQHLASQNICYAEVIVSFSDFQFLTNKISLDDMLTCLEQAKKNAPIQISWIADLVRNNGPEKTLNILQQLINSGKKLIAGITLGGSEMDFPPAPFEKTYLLARQEGLNLTVHAGETLGPESIWDALNLLDVQRIGHGIRAIEDPKLVEYLVNHQIPLEVCISSNIELNIYSDHQHHPIKQLYEMGIPICINTDDPTFFRTDLIKEYEYLVHLDFSQQEIIKIMENAYTYSFAEVEDKKNLVQSFRNQAQSITATR